MCFSLKPDLELCGSGSGQQQCRTLSCAPLCNVSASVTATAGRVSVSRLRGAPHWRELGLKSLIFTVFGFKSANAEVTFTFS